MPKSVTDTLNDAPLGVFHFKAAFIAGMGYFTDAYDLFIIGAAVVLIKGQWHPDKLMIGLVGSMALLAAFLGAFIFGRISDVWGRQRIYGLEAALMTVGALLSAFSPNLIWLLVARFILGLGIGGDYPVSAVIMSEYANVKNRGRMVAIVFSMQAIGLVAGPVVALTLLASGIHPDLAWRLMLGLGAVPAATIIYFRRRMPESPRYTAQVKGQAQTAADNLRKMAGSTDGASVSSDIKAQKLGYRDIFRSRRLLLTLIGTAGTWFLFDYAYYGNSISLPLVLKAVAPHSTDISNMAWSLMIFVIAAVPGYALAFLKIDQVGHKRLQWIGFLIMGSAFGAIALVPHLTTMVIPFLLVFGVSYFFAEFGPNTTTFVLSSELFPVTLRATGNGISAGVAKLGAFIGVFLFPVLEGTLGLNRTMFITFILSMVGLGLTFLLPEPAGRSLEEVGGLSEDTGKRSPLSPAAHQ